MRLPLDILEGQNFARKNHHRVGPRCAGAAELAAVARQPTDDLPLCSMSGMNDGRATCGAGFKIS
jgi:hypothetical protein